MSLIIWKRFALIAALTPIPPALSGSGTVTRRPLPCVLLPTRSSVSKVLAQFMKLVVDQEESTQLFMFAVVRVRRGFHHLFCTKVNTCIRDEQREAQLELCSE